MHRYLNAKEFKTLPLQLISDLKNNSNKHINEVRESMQDLDNMDENSVMKLSF
jgi:hypothetical protein